MKNNAIATDNDIEIDIKIKNILTKAEIISSTSLFIGILIIIVLGNLHNIYDSFLSHNLISLFSGIIIWGINAVNIAYAYHKIQGLLITRYVARAAEQVIRELYDKENKND